MGEGYRNIWVVAEAAGGALLPASLEAHGPGPRAGRPDRRLRLWRCCLGDRAWKPLGEKLIRLRRRQGAGGRRSGAGRVPARGCTPRSWPTWWTQYRPEILLLAATPLGNDLAPRLAQRLDTGLISHCVKLDLDMAERLLLGTFAMLGGEVYHTVACPEARPQMATLQPGYFRLPYEDAYRSGDVQLVELDLGEVQPPA